MKQIRFIVEVITDYDGITKADNYVRSEIDIINNALQADKLPHQPQMGLVDKVNIMIEVLDTEG